MRARSDKAILLAAVDAGEASAVRDFQRGIRAVPGIQRVWLPGSPTAIQIWVLLDQATPDVVEQVFELERELVRRVASRPIEVLVYGEDEIDAAHLPGGRTIYERLMSRAAPG